jgi:hypothetical protein
MRSQESREPGETGLVRCLHPNGPPEGFCSGRASRGRNVRNHRPSPAAVALEGGTAISRNYGLASPEMVSSKFTSASEGGSD